MNARKEMRAALYARVSTNGHGQSVEPQLLELRREIKAAVRKNLERAIGRMPEFYRSSADIKDSTWRSARVFARVAFPLVEEFCGKEGVEINLTRFEPVASHRIAEPRKERKA